VLSRRKNIIDNGLKSSSIIALDILLTTGSNKTPHSSENSPSQNCAFQAVIHKRRKRRKNIFPIFLNPTGQRFRGLGMACINSQKRNYPISLTLTDKEWEIITARREIMANGGAATIKEAIKS
jgi:hypothetical protein